MAFCASCGTPNPDGAKFCAKCGQGLEQAVQPVQPAPAQPVQPAPAQPVRPAPAQPVQPAPAQPAQPAPAQPAQPVQAPQPTAKEALASPPVPAPSAVKPGPDPNAPGQTQFFMAAAGVSTGSKVKRIILFVLGALIVGTGIFALIHYGFMKKSEPAPKAPADPAATQPAPTPEPAPAATADPAAVDGGPADEAKADAPAAEPAKAEPAKPAKPVAKRKKRKKRKRRAR